MSRLAREGLTLKAPGKTVAYFFFRDNYVKYQALFSLKIRAFTGQQSSSESHFANNMKNISVQNQLKSLTHEI